MKYLIFGGTGTLGKAVTKRLMRDDNTQSVIIFSRDEFKQQEMKKEFHSDRHRLYFVIGDVKDPESFKNIPWGCDTVMNFAALKHIDVAERNPVEALRNNVYGTINTLEYTRQQGSLRYVFSSTDKAVDPINAYGYTKALSEKIINNSAYYFDRFIFRWGNIWASRGSVINYFIDCIHRREPAKITTEDMTRYWLSIKDAADYVVDIVANYHGGLFIPHSKIRSAKIIDIYRTLCQIYKQKENYELIGNRGSEKVHERLNSIHDAVLLHPFPDDDKSSAGYRPYTEKELHDIILEYVTNGQN